MADTTQQALQQAQKALDKAVIAMTWVPADHRPDLSSAIEAIDAALSFPVEAPPESIEVDLSSGDKESVREQAVAWIEHHKGGDNLVWEETRLKCTPLYAAPLPAVQTVPEEAILHRMKYHIHKADPNNPEDVDDWQLYEPNIECGECVDVLIVRVENLDREATIVARNHIGDANKMVAHPEAPDAIRDLLMQHATLIEEGNSSAYFELAYTRQTGWMAWLTDRPASGEPGTAEYAKSRKVIARGQGDTPDEACADALAALHQAHQKEGAAP